jgi:hypothetical protein
MVAKLTEAELSSNLDRHVSLGADCKVIVSPVALLPWSNMSMRWRPRASSLAVPMRGSKARQALCRCWLRALLLLRPLRQKRRRQMPYDSNLWKLQPAQAQFHLPPTRARFTRVAPRRRLWGARRRLVAAVSPSALRTLASSGGLPTIARQLSTAAAASPSAVELHP